MRGGSNLAILVFPYALSISGILLFNNNIYYIDTSVLLENIPLVKFIKLHPGPEWFIFHNLTREFIDDFIDYQVCLIS